MNKYKFLSLALLIMTTVTSCTYLFGTPTQKITITATNIKSNSKQQAVCLVKNGTGMWRAVTGTPFEVRESNTDLKISCSSKSLRAHKVVKADAHHEYPSIISIQMYKPKKNEPESEEYKDMVLPKDNDDSSSAEVNPDDADHGAGNSKPLNILPEEPTDSQDVEIIRH